jgi:hypothetical protein
MMEAIIRNCWRNSVTAFPHRRPGHLRLRDGPGRHFRQTFERIVVDLMLARLGAAPAFPGLRRGALDDWRVALPMLASAAAIRILCRSSSVLALAS